MEYFLRSAIVNNKVIILVTVGANALKSFW